MREHSQQSVNGEMQKRVRDYRYNYRKEQGVATVCARTRDNPAKRHVKRVADGDDKLYEPGAAPCRQQGQQKTHSEQRIDYVENVIYDLRNSRQPARALDFTFSFNDLVYCLRTKLTGDLIDSLRYARRCLYCGALADLSLDFPFNLTLYRLVLRRVLLLRSLTYRRSSISPGVNNM